ncbi:MAG: DUF1345 domain-containing protein [Thermoleophilia bacterium]|nr:DUF1345 domain-containing protein [Thermoleophilia bacterium]
MLARHRRFLVALGLGLLTVLALAGQPPVLRALAGVDAFCAVFLAATARHALVLSPSQLRDSLAETDEGIPVIFALALLVVMLGIGAVIALMGSARPSRPVEVALAVAAVPLSWAMLQTLLGLHYARIFHGEAAAGAQSAADGGIRFAGTPDPGLWDFLYFSFTVGMTAQVSDVTVASPAIRRMVLGHAVLAFFYNTVILALAVNAAASLGA